MEYLIGHLVGKKGHVFLSLPVKKYVTPKTLTTCPLPLPQVPRTRLFEIGVNGVKLFFLADSSMAGPEAAHREGQMKASRRGLVLETCTRAFLAGLAIPLPTNLHECGKFHFGGVL